MKVKYPFWKPVFEGFKGAKIQKATVIAAFVLPVKGKFVLKVSVLIIELKSSPNLKHYLWLGGENEIRTRGTGCPVRRFSKPVVSATHPSLRARFREEGFSRKGVQI